MLEFDMIPEYLESCLEEIKINADLKIAEIESGLFDNLDLTATPKNVFNLSFMDINVILNFHYELGSNFERDLETKYSPYRVKNFQKTRNSLSCEINFHLDPNHSELGDAKWNTTEPFMNSYREGQKEFFVCRDFIGGLINNDFHIYGPAINEFNPDTLDNALLMALCYVFPRNDRTIVHSAAVVNDEKAYLFFAPSGHGKSTISKQLNTLEGLKVIASDNLLLKYDKKENTVFAQCTPITDPDFPIGSKSKITRVVKVQGIFYLTKTRDFHFTERKATELLTKFLREQLFMYFDFVESSELLELSGKILEAAPCIGEVGFKLDKRFWSQLMAKVGGN